MDTFTQRMLKRSLSRREKQKAPEHYAALLRKKSFVLKAVDIDYEDGSSEAQRSEYTGHSGVMPVYITSLDPREELKITSVAQNDVSGTISQDGFENKVTVSSPTKQPCNSVEQCSKGSIFHALPIHTSLSSESVNLGEEQKTCSILQNYTSQDGGKSEVIVSPPAELSKDLSLGAMSVAGSVKQKLQVEVEVHQPMIDWDSDSDSAAGYFSPCALLTLPVPAERQEVYNSGLSSDAGKGGHLKMAEQLLLADEVCEMEGNAEQYMELSSNVSYDMKSFLIEALGDELLATAQSEPQLCHRSSQQPSVEEEGDGSQSPFLTVRKYRTLTQLARQKLRPPLPMIPLLKPVEPACSVEGEQEKYKESLMQEVHTQKVLMLQCSKALSICKTTREFHASVEHAEAERALLLSSYRYHIALKEFERVQYQKTEGDVTERGSVTICSISLSLKKDFSKMINSDEFVFWFVCIASHGKHVFATQAIQSQQDIKLNFRESLEFVGLPKDFVITLEVYSLRLRRVILPHEERYHIEQKLHMFPVLFKLHHRNSQLDFSPYTKIVKMQPIHTTSFNLIGSLHLKLADLHLQPAWILSKVPLSSPLTGDVIMVLHSSLELRFEYSGFLNMMETCGFWQRHWCCLKGHTVSYWNYPLDQFDKPPVGAVDLRLCVSECVGPVDRPFCPRPRTLLLEISSQSNVEDCNTQDTIIRHLWQADSAEMLSEWCTKLTGVICALKRWNVTAQHV